MKNRIIEPYKDAHKHMKIKLKNLSINITFDEDTYNGTPWSN